MADVRELLINEAKKTLGNPFHEGRIDLNDWIDATPPDREWLIKDLIPMNAVTTLFGTGGIGKSLLCQQLATSLALGKHTFGETPRQYRVLGMYCEDDKDELIRRQQAICNHYGVSVADVSDRLHLYSFTEQDAFLAKAPRGTLEVTNVYKSLEIEISRLDPDLVIIDNISQVLNGSKVDEAVVTSFFAELRKLCRNSSLLIVGHTGKPASEGKTTEYYGSVAFNNAGRQRLFLEKDGDEVILSARKSNYGGTTYSRTMFYRGGAFELINPQILAKQRESDKLDKINKGRQAILKFIEDGISKGVYYRPSNNAIMSVVKAMEACTDLNKGLNKHQLRESLQTLMNDGILSEEIVGRDASRNKKMGLLIKNALSSNNENDEAAW